MKQVHTQEKDQFKKLFKQENIDRFEDRFRVLETFMNTERHLTAEELTGLLEERGHRFEPDFVSDTLKLMAKFGFARKNRFDDGRVRYEHMHLGQHHDHMICTKCKDIIEFSNEELENIQLKIAREKNFHMLQHKMEIYGICSKCFKERVPLIDLSSARSGERLIIRKVQGGIGRAHMRLLHMGLRVGDKIEVLNNIGRGQLVVSAGTSRYVLGRGLARKIMVEPEKT